MYQGQLARLNRWVRVFVLFGYGVVDFEPERHYLNQTFF
jgi:hypothetical protein